MIDWPSIAFLALTAFSAGAIRGFAGFGDALVFLPIASLFLSPILAIALFALIGVLGPLTMMAQAWREVDRKLFTIISITMLVFVPLGFWLLTISDPALFKLCISLMAILLVVTTAFGLRISFVIREMGAFIVGATSGVIGGFSGAPGTLFAFVFLNSQLSAAQMRALMTLLLLLFDATMLALTGFEGAIKMSFFGLALVLLPAYIIGNRIGKHLFDPTLEAGYRNLALLVILASGLIGLPWDKFGLF